MKYQYSILAIVLNVRYISDTYQIPILQGYSLMHARYVLDAPYLNNKKTEYLANTPIASTDVSMVCGFCFFPLKSIQRKNQKQMLYKYFLDLSKASKMKSRKIWDTCMSVLKI